MKYFYSKLDQFYNLHYNCAVDHAFIEDPKGMSEPHHHEDFEIYFLVSGNRKYFISNTIYTLRPNQIVIFKPNVPHQVTVNLNIPYERHLLYVSPFLFSQILKENQSLESISDTQLFNLSENDFNYALQYVTKINNELTKKDTYAPDIIKSHIAELLLFIERHNDESNLFVDKSDSRIQAAIDFIIDNYAYSITLNDCAKVACMSPTHFSKTFHKITAIGFKDFLNKIRIDKACELLENTDYSISRIAQSVGFSTESHFGFTFKSINHISPSKYRTELMNYESIK